MKIKTLADILAESDNDSASRADAKSKRPNKPDKSNQSSHQKTSQKFKQHFSYSDKEDVVSSNTSHTNSDNNTVSIPSSSAAGTLKTAKSKKRKKRFHPAANFTAEPNDNPAYQPPEAQTIKQMLTEVKHQVHNSEYDGDRASDTSDMSFNENDGIDAASLDNPDMADQTDNLPAALKAYLRTPEQRQADIDAIKAESRLRWLAFYYLSRREYGKAELKQKLIDKEQDPEKIDALLDEFEEKGYQSDYRTTLMLIRENIRKGRGRGRIKQEFYRKKIAMPGNIDELIDMSNAESDEFIDFVEDDTDSLVDGVDWLKLAVTARTKKYGNDIPTEQKDKAKQLRFLQYRGFNTDICFAALNHTLQTLDDRF